MLPIVQSLAPHKPPYWCGARIPKAGGLKQESKVEGYLLLPKEFEASLGYVKPLSKQQQQQTTLYLSHESILKTEIVL